MFLDLLLACAALLAALLTRPWRAVTAPPWPWLAGWALLPVLWGADRYAAMPIAQPLSGACLLMLMCGWPLAVLAFVPAAAVTAFAAGLDAAEALHRGVWLGLVPASLAMGLGAAIRRWLPPHLFVYILGRGFFATAVAGAGAGLAAIALDGVPPGLQRSDLMLGRAFAAWGDAFIAGMVVAIFVAYRPQWLATYHDRLYLPTDRPAP